MVGPTVSIDALPLGKGPSITLRLGTYSKYNPEIMYFVENIYSYDVLQKPFIL